MSRDLAHATKRTCGTEMILTRWRKRHRSFSLENPQRLAKELRSVTISEKDGIAAVTMVKRERKS